MREADEPAIDGASRRLLAGTGGARPVPRHCAQVGALNIVYDSPRDEETQGVPVMRS